MSRLAYARYDDFDGGTEVVFLTPDQAEEGDLTKEDRTPEFDQYAEKGSVPSRELLNHGWYLFCSECERRSDCEEDADYGGRRVEDTFLGDWYFCHPDCAAATMDERRRRKEEHDEIAAEFEGKYPWAKCTWSCGDLGDLTTFFEFPGGKGSLTHGVATFRGAAFDAWHNLEVVAFQGLGHA